MEFSITIRPLQETFDRIRPDSNFYHELQQKLKDIGKSFIISLEKDNHYQIGLRLKIQKRKDNLKRLIMTILKRHITINVDEEKNSIMVKNHKDYKGLVGYCLKESIYNDVYNLETGFLHDCKKYYEKLCDLKKFKYDKIKVNNRNLGVYFMKYYETHKIKFFLDEGNKERLVINVLSAMDRDGYYMSNILCSRNILTTVKYLEAKLKKNMSQFIIDNMGGAFDSNN